jgi:hypothetical protein
MFMPPTMMPNDLRVLVDPPIDFVALHRESSRRPSMFSRISRAIRGTRATEAEPCGDAARPAARTLLGSSTACPD